MWSIFGVIAVLMLLRARAARACTTVLVGRDASETGEVLVGHNEDSSGRYVMRTHLVPALPRGASPGTIRFEPNAAELSLPAERPKLFWSEARPYVSDGGASFCDFHVNGNGVVICSDNCGKSREDRPELTGGVGYGVRRLTAERARSAYNAVEVAVELVDRYGYIGGGRSYHFADRNEIWVMQIVNGKHYAIKRVPDDHVYVNPNHYTIRQPDPDVPGLEKLIADAIERGWYDPASGPFDFARAYQAPEAYRSERNLHRHLRGLEILPGCTPPEGDLPFSVRPARGIGVEDVKKVLRCHFEGTPDDVSGGDSPHFMETRPICHGTTLESTIVQIRKNHDMTLIRRALGRPCLAPYTPWYFGVTAVPAKYSGGDPENAVRTHFAVPPEDLNHTDAAWFRNTDLQTAIDPLYGEEATAAKKAIAELEETLENEVRGFEPSVVDLFAVDSKRARELLTGSVLDWTTRALDRLENLFAALDVLKLDAPGGIDVGDGKTPVSVRVPLQALKNRPGGDLTPDFGADDIALDRTLFGPGHAPSSKWSRAVGATARQGQLCLSFGTGLEFGRGEWAKKLVPCLTDMWLILENKKGRRLVGRALSRLTGAPRSASVRGPSEECSACDA
ncbi:MAG: C69 family dipeptidase [Synergistaceae bacterium]|jgi:dipeptidase|nr:C69 family dipeptidase [Synergistaceae bacterium]